MDTVISPFCSRSYGRRRYCDDVEFYPRSYRDLIDGIEGLELHDGRLNSVHNLRDRSRPPKDNLNWNLDYATAYVTEFLAKSTKEGGLKIARAIDRARHYNNDTDDPEKFLCEVFDAIDEALFDSKLSDGVYLCWAPLGRGVPGATWLPGKAAARVAIVLNDMMLWSRKTDGSRLVSMLTHQMIHAYFVIACPEPPEAQEVDARLGHGKHFGKIMQTIQSLLATHGRDLSLMNGRELSLDPPYGGNHHPQYLTLSAASGCGSGLHGAVGPGGKQVRSTCPLHGACNHSDLEQWYSSTCAPLLDAPECTHLPTINTITDSGKVVEISRSSAGPSDSYVEFVHGGKSFQCFLSKIDAHASLKKKCKRVMKIPKPVPKDTFKCLMSFLNKGSYGPDLSKVQVPGATGPPLIAESKVDEPPYLLTAIAVFKLADILGFDELRANALQRLKDQHITFEDPLPSLSEIYDPAKSYLPPDKQPHVHPDLRTWSREWLQKHDVALTAAHGPASPLNTSNLARMAHDPRLAPLLARSPALAEDLRIAREHLLLLTQTRAPLSYPHTDPHRHTALGRGGVGGGVGVARVYTPPYGVSLEALVATPLDEAYMEMLRAAAAGWPTGRARYPGQTVAMLDPAVEWFGRRWVAAPEENVYASFGPGFFWA